MPEAHRARTTMMPRRTARMTMADMEGRGWKIQNIAGLRPSASRKWPADPFPPSKIPCPGGPPQVPWSRLSMRLPIALAALAALPALHALEPLNPPVPLLAPLAPASAGSEALAVAAAQRAHALGFPSTAVTLYQAML